MSIGIGAFAHLVLQDEETVIYEYGGYNLNDEQFTNSNYLCDGLIIVGKRCFQEPEIHEKVKRMPSGRKKQVVKRIIIDVDYPKLIDDGLIVVENCSNTWKTYCDEKQIDIMALRLLFELFRQYQTHSVIPEKISYSV